MPSKSKSKISVNNLINKFSLLELDSEENFDKNEENDTLIKETNQQKKVDKLLESNEHESCDENQDQNNVKKEHPNKELAVSKMTLEQIKAELQLANQSTKGNRKELSKKLRNFRQNNKRTKPFLKQSDESRGRSKTRYLCFIDFEATCKPNVPFKMDHHEIIEFPAVLVDSIDGSQVSLFHHFVRPTFEPILSDFCKELTNINQELIDQSFDFPTVLEKFNDWIDDIITNQVPKISYDDITLVTHGSADFNNFLASEFQRHKIKRQGIFAAPVHFIDLRAYIFKVSQIFKEFVVPPYVTLAGMLRVMDLEPLGKAHSGVDDAVNLARVAERLLQEGYYLVPNAKF